MSASRYQANLGIRHASLSETAALYLISRSDLGVVIHSESLHSRIFTLQSNNQWLTLCHSKLIINMHFTINMSTVHTCSSWVCTYFMLYFACRGFTHVSHTKRAELVTHSPNVSDTLRIMWQIHHRSSTAQRSNIAAWENKIHHCILCLDQHWMYFYVDCTHCIAVPRQPPYWIDLSFGPGNRAKWAEY